jgi:hypothetical protein
VTDDSAGAPPAESPEPPVPSGGTPDPDAAAGESADGHGEEGAAADLAVPESLRRRIAQYAAQVLQELEPNDVPPRLRFAQRWRRGALPGEFGERLVAALEAEDAFRSRIATRLIDTDPLATAVSDAGPVEGADEASVGALLFLLRPERWQERLSALLRTARSQDAPEDRDRARLQREADDLRSRLARLQQRRDRELAAAREETSATEARLGAAIARLREQLTEAVSGRDQATAQAQQAQRLLQDRERELRRVRGQLEQARAVAERTRSAEKDARLRATGRAKLLLEVLEASVAGLGEELGLTGAAPLPGDLVPAVEPAAPSLPKRLHSSEELAQMLTLPRCHLLVDGYNISKGLWPTAPLQQQRDRLVTALAALQARTAAEVTVVFDGADVGAVPAVAARGVRVRFSEPGELADRVLVRMVGAEPGGRPMVVASSDQALTSGARSAGARTVDREVLCALLPT